MMIPRLNLRDPDTLLQGAFAASVHPVTGVVRSQWAKEKEWVAV
jgi:hypothetical protein